MSDRDARSLRARLARARASYGDAPTLRTWLFYLPGPFPWLGSWLRRRWVLFRNPHVHIEFAWPVYLGPGFSLHAPDGGTFIAAPGVEFRRNFRAELGGPDARIEIGPGAKFTHGVILSCDTSITVGANAILGQDAYVADGNHRYRDINTPFLDQGYDYRPIRIGYGAIVHSKVTIVNDIGERAIIGANAVITKPIPAFCVAAGVPARVLDYYGPEASRPRDLAAVESDVEHDSGSSTRSG